MRQIRLRTILIAILVLSLPLAWLAARWKKERALDASLAKAIEEAIAWSKTPEARSARFIIFRDGAGPRTNSEASLKSKGVPLKVIEEAR